VYSTGVPRRWNWPATREVPYSQGVVKAGARKISMIAHPLYWTLELQSGIARIIATVLRVMRGLKVEFSVQCVCVCVCRLFFLFFFVRISAGLIHVCLVLDTRPTTRRRNSLETQRPDLSPRASRDIFAAQYNTAKAASGFKKNCQITRGSRAQTAISSNNLWEVGYVDDVVDSTADEQGQSSFVSAPSFVCCSVLICGYYSISAMAVRPHR